MDAPEKFSPAIQVEPAHYHPAEYLDSARMASIGHQIQLVHSTFRAGSVLEVGVGSGLATMLLRQMGHAVRTLDFDANLHPDLVGSVTQIPAGPAEFDCFLCAQVLEHLPWDQVDTALGELARVVKSGGVLSVPTLRPRLGIAYYDWKRSRTRWVTRPGRLGKPMREKTQHHWELEANVRTEAFLAKIAKAGFQIVREFQPSDNMYHHFFLLRKRSI